MGSMIDNLDYKDKVIQTQGRMLFVQPGCKTFHFDSPMTGVNLNSLFVKPVDDLGIVGTGSETYWTKAGYTTDSEHTFYKWGEKVKYSIQNHSPLPVYVKAYYVSPRIHIPIIISAHSGNLERRESAANIFAAGLASKGVSLFNGAQGWTGEGAFNYGEGQNSGPATGVRKPWATTDLFNKYVSVPLGFSFYDSVDFHQLFNVYNTESIMLNPEQMHTFAIQDTDLKYMHETRVGGIAEVDVWNKTEWDYNTYAKFIVIETSGSLVGQSLTSAATVDSIGTAAWPITSGLDTVNLMNILDKVTSHGGVIYSFSSRQYHVGYIEDETEDDIQIQGNSAKLGKVDDPLSAFTEVDVHLT